MRIQQISQRGKQYLKTAETLLRAAQTMTDQAIDALLGTKRVSTRVVPDETKLAITNCASHGAARSKAFGAVQHRSLLLVSSLFADHRFEKRYCAWPAPRSSFLDAFNR